MSEKTAKKTYILVHGSWHNGTCWAKVQDLLETNGQLVFTPTLTGMESVNKPAGKDIGLHTHVQDIIRLIEENNLTDVILVGHSYAGLVISEVASKISNKISQLVFLDAFITDYNSSLFDISAPERVELIKESLVNDAGCKRGEGCDDVWLVPPRTPETFGVTNPEDIKLLKRNLVYTPVRTFEEKVDLDEKSFSQIPKSYIACTQVDILHRFHNKASEMGMHMYRIDTGHDAMITEPELVTNILLRLV